MTERKGLLCTCDYPGCGEWCFREYIGQGVTDGGYTTWDKFELYPDGWERTFKGRMLCPSHAAKWAELKDAFWGDDT